MKPTCSESGCEKPAKARGICDAHLYHAYKNKKLPPKINVRAIHEKTCPVCGELFKTKDESKTYCKQRCYLNSQKFKDIHSKRMVRVENTCFECKEQFLTRVCQKRKFCSKKCFREFFSSRFDRFVANPEKIALPQCYDEFLTQEELPCLIEGCNWSGKCLGIHVNLFHGITAEKFREMAGFNRGTALVTMAVSDYRSEVAKRVFKEEDRHPIDQCDHVQRGKTRLEGKEHAVKVRSFPEVKESMRKAGVRSSTQETREKARKGIASRRLIELVKVCEFCEKEYTTNLMSAKRSRFCGKKCRNGFNRKRCKLGNAIPPVAAGVKD